MADILPDTYPQFLEDLKTRIKHTQIGVNLGFV